MPPRAPCYSQVSTALHKDGWSIEPATVRIDADIQVIIDLAATNNGRRGYFDIACFTEGALEPSIYTAIGRYVVHRELIRKVRPAADLYLVIPTQIYQSFTGVLQQTIVNNTIQLI